VDTIFSFLRFLEEFVGFFPIFVCFLFLFFCYLFIKLGSAFFPVKGKWLFIVMDKEAS
jgi:hypothetical protein